MSMALYLDHYMGSSNHIPTELKRNFSLMHDLDARVQSLMKKIDQRSDHFLANIEKFTDQERKKQRKKIQFLFNKAREYGDKKIQIAIDSYELVDKFINRLDGDMEKYKAIISGKNKKGGARKGKKRGAPAASASNAAKAPKLADGENESSRKKKSPNENETDTGAGPSGDGAEVGTSGEGAPQTSGAAGEATTKVEGEPSQGPSGEAPAKADEEPPAESLDLSQISDLPDMPVDPNEPTYCVCNQVSYGEMIACDNPDCAIEWFHFPCVGLTGKPSGEWFCPKCTAERKKPVRSWNRPKFVIKPK